MTLLVFLLFALFCGVVWRLRGGAFTTLTGWDPGTDGARAIAAVLIPLALALLTQHAALMVLSVPLMLGLLVDGWGPFEGMGLQPTSMPERSWLRVLPIHLGLPEGTFWHDFVGIAEAGVVCMLPAFIAAVWLGQHSWVLLLAGLGFAPSYALARLGFPTIPNFASGQSWGEIFAGAVVGAGFFIVFS